MHRNGDIIGYLVRYGVLDNLNETMNVMGSATTKATIAGLNTATNYSFEVAAVNSAGIGMYSAAIFAITQGIWFRQFFKPLTDIPIKYSIALLGTCMFIYFLVHSHTLLTLLKL